MKIRTLPIIISIIALFSPMVVSAQQPEGPHVLLGSQSSALYYEAFCKQVVEKTTSAGHHEAVILLIPMGDVVKEGSLAASDRTSLLKNAEIQKSSLEAACNKVSAADISYQIVILPVFTREDAAETSLATYSNLTPAGILVLEGDLLRGIDIIDNTPFENVLHTLFQNPQIVIGGVGNGADYLAQSRITGSNPAYAMENPLQFDSIRVQQGDAFLSTIGDQVLIDHDIFSGMGIPEMINALTPSNQPHIGIGLDGPVGVPIDADNKIEGIIGDGRVIILDTETYHAAETTEYQGINNSLSVRNILVQSLDPGDFTYDLGSRQHSLAKPQSSLLRAFNYLYTPARSGEIYLMGSTPSELKDTETYMDFINSSGGKSATMLAIAAGYPDNETAEKEIKNISKVFGIPMDSVVDPGDPRLQTANLAEYSGIILSVPENNHIDGWLDKLIPMKNSWSRGIPILALGQASAILGSYYPGAENGSVMEPGLGLLNAIFIPGSGYSNDWQQLFQAATSQPKIVSFLIPKDASIIVDPLVSRVSGEDAIVSLDLRNSTATSSDKSGSGFANGLLDVFAPGDIIQPQFADINMIPLRAATPIIPTPTQTSTVIPSSTPSPTSTPEQAEERIKAPTRTPRPTSTPLTIPPPSDPESINFMVFFGVVSVIVVLIGVWINRAKAIR